MSARKKLDEVASALGSVCLETAIWDLSAQLDGQQLESVSTLLLEAFWTAERRGYNRGRSAGYDEGYAFAAGEDS